MISIDWYNRQKAIAAATKQKQAIAVAELMWQQGLSERREQAARLATQYRVAPYVKDVPQSTLEPRTELCLVGALVGRCH